ncbi:MAG: DNA adenine methylase [Candidatus Aenigmatarchaeota archaeon]
MIKPLMTYPGSKFWFVKGYMHLINWYIISNKIKTVVDVFGGSGVLILNITPKVNRVYNDIDYRLYCVFDCLTKEEERNKLISMFKYSFPHQQKFKEFLKIKKQEPKVYTAFKTLYILNTSFSSRVNPPSFAPTSTKRPCNKYNTLKMRLLNVVSLSWDYFSAYNLQYESVLKKFGGPHTLFLLDPPYLSLTHDFNLYHNSTFTLDDHKKMYTLLTESGSKYILFEINEGLSGIYGPPALKVSLKTTTNNVNKKKREVREEIIWTNIPSLFKKNEAQKTESLLEFTKGKDD